MSWCWYEATCPVCGEDMDVYEDYKPCPIVICQCYNCGFCTTTESTRMTLKEINEQKKDQGIKLLTKKQYDKFKDVDFTSV